MGLQRAGLANAEVDTFPEADESHDGSSLRDRQAENLVCWVVGGNDVGHLTNQDIASDAILDEALDAVHFYSARETARTV